MRPISALIACTFVLVASAALADSRVFIIANEADGYGIDQCIARGDRCGASAARAYCRSRDFAQASNYRRVDPDEIDPLDRRAPVAGRRLGGHRQGLLGVVPGHRRPGVGAAAVVVRMAVVVVERD